jgi:GNAT superfamily N-acetyltransferase
VSIAVRRATPEDDRFISALGSTCAASSISQIRRVSEPVVALSFQRLLMFCRERPGTIDLIAEVDGERAGFLILLTDIPAFMAVAEPLRRTGIGKALMRNAETEARRLGLPHLSLMVSADNVGARGLYAGEGFVEERMLLTKALGEPA